MKATITDRYVNLEGFKYFVGQASSTALGAYGDKKTKLLGTITGKLTYLDVWDLIPAPKLAKIKLNLTELKVEFQDEKGLNLFVGAKIPGLASAKVGLKVSDFSSGYVKLVKVSPQGENELIKQINDSPKVLNKLIELGGSARVVKSVLIAIEGKLFDKFSAGLTNNGAVNIDGVLVQVERSADWQKSTTVEFGKDTTIAYNLAEPVWDAKQDKNKTKVLDLRDDQPGI